MSNQNTDKKEYEYLDLLDKKLDKKQYAVCCSLDNTIVAAGAGSGKTQVLATRFAWLVMSKGIPASQILTLTFTKKAAGEMYERIYKTLTTLVQNPATPELERKRAQQALEDFSETHIQTLDSYCSSIVKQAANRYGIRPDFTAGGSESLEDIKKLALPYVLTNRGRPCVQQFARAGKLEMFTNDILAKAVSEYTTLADPADFFVSKIPLQKQILLENWNCLIGGSNNGERPAQALRLKEILPLYMDACNQAFHTKGQNEYIEKAILISELLSQTDTKICSTFEEMKQAASRFYENLQIIQKIKFPTRGYTSELRAKKKLLMEDFITPVIPLVSYIFQLEQTQELYKMFDEFTAKVNESKRRTGNLIFADISELALKILREQPDILIQEQNAYQKIMIDEFQDNNGKNKELLFLLADGKQKLFFVGDEKQSIYKFRGADVSVFNGLKEDFGNDSIKKMNYNYRSNNELLATFNHIFGKNDLIFDNSLDRPFEAKYLDKAIKYDPKNKVELPEADLTKKSNKKMDISLLDSTDLDKEEFFSPKDQLAIYIAQKILAHKKEMEKSGKPYPFSEYAILDRGRTDRRYLIKWLNAFDIPYTMDKNTSIFSDGPINDIYNFIQLCVYPQDRISLAGYLASPFANLNEQSIETVLACETPEDLLEENEKNKYKAAMDFYNAQRPLTLSRPLTKTLEILWNDCGYRYETMLSYKKSLYAEQFDMLFELARQTDSNDKGIAWFADQLSQIKDNEISSFGTDIEINVDELTYPIEKGDAVNIMTIHKSKGLQFGYVFVYGCTNVSKGSKDSQFYFDETCGLTIKPQDKSKNFFYLRQEDKAIQEELAEFRRIIYVGITRAEDYVEIVGSWKQEETESATKEDSFRLIENMVRWYKSHPDETQPYNFYDISPVKRNEMWPILNASNNLAEEKIKLEKASVLYKGEPSIKYEWPESNRKTPSSLEKEYIAYDTGCTDIVNQDSDSGIKYESSEDVLTEAAFTAADFGTLVHAYLEAQANGISCEDFKPQPKLLKNLKEKQEQLNPIIETCRNMCREFSASELGKQFEQTKKAGRFYHAEWAFRMFLDNYIFTGSIDLIFENEDGSYTIVDYKSDQQIDPEKYRGQQDCYKKAAARMLGVSEDKIKCWLYFLRHKQSTVFQ